jgi:hypothetical protein
LATHWGNIRIATAVATADARWLAVFLRTALGSGQWMERVVVRGGIFVKGRFISIRVPDGRRRYDTEC